MSMDRYSGASPTRSRIRATRPSPGHLGAGLEHDRQTERAARALHIHPKTLLYRVRRFEQVSGCSLGSTESLAEVWLALRATAAVPDVAHRPSAGLGFQDS